MTGYLGMPEETSDALVGGWVRTGDVGYLDVGGNLFIKDRIRDVVISGGLNIYPSDIEAVLSRHEAVLDAVVPGTRRKMGRAPGSGGAAEAGGEDHSRGPSQAGPLVHRVRSKHRRSAPRRGIAAEPGRYCGARQEPSSAMRDDARRGRDEYDFD